VAEYQILYWKDLPAQVRTRDGVTQVKKVLPERFQQAIDARAMLENSTDEESYLAGWRWSEWHARPGDAQTVLNQVIAELEAYLDPRH
jgi:Virulence factor